MHRDIKPENFLLSVKQINLKGVGDGQVREGAGITTSQIKLADFGLARDARQNTQNMTEYVSTRWYRAPELVMKSRSYSNAIDIFALGAIMTEMVIGRPVFPGRTESDQLTAIVTVLGTPSQAQWPEGHRLATQHGIKFPQINQSSLSSTLEENSVSLDAIDLIKKMLDYNPQKRITAQQCLQHSFFKNVTLSQTIGAQSKPLL